MKLKKITSIQISSETFALIGVRVRDWFTGIPRLLLIQRVYLVKIFLSVVALLLVGYLIVTELFLDPPGVVHDPQVVDSLATEQIDTLEFWIDTRGEERQQDPENYSSLLFELN